VQLHAKLVLPIYDIQQPQVFELVINGTPRELGAVGYFVSILFSNRQTLKDLAPRHWHAVPEQAVETGPVVNLE